MHKLLHQRKTPYSPILGGPTCQGKVGTCSLFSGGGGGYSYKFSIGRASKTIPFLAAHTYLARIREKLTPEGLFCISVAD